MPLRPLGYSIRGAKRESRQISPDCRARTPARNVASPRQRRVILLSYSGNVQEYCCELPRCADHAIVLRHPIPDRPLVCAVAWGGLSRRHRVAAVRAASALAVGHSCRAAGGFRPLQRRVIFADLSTTGADSHLLLMRTHRRSAHHHRAQRLRWGGQRQLLSRLLSAGGAARILLRPGHGASGGWTRLRPLCDVRLPGIPDH